MIVSHYLFRYIVSGKHETMKHCCPNHLSPHDGIKASFYIPENRLNFPTTKVTKGFRTKISMKLVYQYVAM